MATDLTLYLDDQPGELARVGDVLGNAGTNIAGLCAITTGGGQAEVHILVQDATSAFEALQDAGIKIAAEQEVIVLDVEDRPGALGEVAHRLGEAKVNLTTAYLALQLYQPDVVAVVIPFDQIEDAVHRGDVDVGLLIHEGQLTYADTGLHLWADLGAWWLEDTGLPLPLGGNAVRRNLGRVVIDQIARDLRASIVYALEHRAPALAHAKQFNRGIGDERTDTFVGMYVNDWTVDYGPRGREAVQTLLDRGHAAGLLRAWRAVRPVEGRSRRARPDPADDRRPERARHCREERGCPGGAGRGARRQA